MLSSHCPFQVDPSGPLATLRKILLSEESIASLRLFLLTHWYTVIFIIVGVLILMVRECYSDRTNTNNGNMKVEKKARNSGSFEIF